jgi:hypothetical protein
MSQMRCKSGVQVIPSHDNEGFSYKTKVKEIRRVPPKQPNILIAFKPRLLCTLLHGLRPAISKSSEFIKRGRLLRRANFFFFIPSMNSPFFNFIAKKGAVMEKKDYSPDSILLVQLLN